MVYIRGLKFRGFKSFRRAEANFPNSYVCLAGPNGSGKSNVTDGIRFALGEASLKALRAKKVSELINTSCKVGEVTLYIDGERQFEIKRAINEEGKTLYKINGKRSTRTLIMEELRQYGLEAGSHNIIAQGQVQKIVEMNSKERRQIIDGVAGISEYDAKKAEALSELSGVEQKITEASIVLGEREALLNELEKEKDNALAYLDAQDNFKRSKASIAHGEYNKLSKSHADTIRKHTEAKAAVEEIEKQAGVLSGRIAELGGQKQQVVEKMGSSASREAMLAEIEELKVKGGADSATLSERKKEAERLSSSSKALEARGASLKKSQKDAAASVEAIAGKLGELSAQVSDFEKKSGVMPSSGSEIERKLEFVSSKITSFKEQKAASDSSLSESQKMLEMKKQEKERFSSTMPEAKDGRLSGEMSLLKKDVAARQAELDSLFEKERELNRAVPELDRKLLALKEKAATVRATIAPSATSLALVTVQQMKQEGMNGIHGTVSSLVKCDAKYNTAIEAAAGQRLNYVIVDSMDVAIGAIAKLKAQKAGRCSFIPLRLPQEYSARKMEKPPAGCIGSLIEFVDFDPMYKEAMGYVFSDTLLFDNVQSAKRAGVGKARMVTFEGELIEKSGIITGGAQRGSLLSKSSLDRIESDVDEVKKERDSLYSELYALRDSMSAKRREKADAEVKLRGMEIELESANENEEKGRKAQKTMEEISAQLLSIQTRIAELGRGSETLAGELADAIAEHSALKAKQAEANELAKQADAESQKKLQKMLSQKSSLEAQLDAKKAELERVASEISEKESEAKENASSLAACKKEIIALTGSIAETQKVQKEKEVKLSEISAASKKLMDKMGELEAQIADIGAQLGKIKVDSDRKNKELTTLEISRQTVEIHLSDLKADLDTYSGVALIDAPKTELEELSRKSHASMDALGAVNLRAPELYVQKKKDIEDVKTRVSSLLGEKNAVINMMDEIDARKRAIFLSTFSAVNDNFKRLFGYAFPGEGTLILDQPSSPFEGGLHVKVKEGNRDKYLDSMSGGEKALVALMFIFSIQMYKAAPFYILDEADAALDKENSKKLAELIKKLSAKTQFIVVTHNDTILSNADVALGVTRTEDGSKIVGVQLTSAVAAKVKN